MMNAGSHFGEAKKVSRPRRDKAQSPIHQKHKTKHSQRHLDFTKLCFQAAYYLGCPPK
ncbi:hypothetical protein GCWU000324_00750 [Kingella oralis ATCC 51147]|uniref:Uncharacterized protein n=1 Tax=Kingella oralis ATCC 51147 TaxID=629741 RepID=C4GF36_9NEIS|nr:hypothetical protein GCWU000324_00750 [Kingella oralis ATCC 51147]